MALQVLRFSIDDNGNALFPELFTFVELDESNPYSVRIGDKTWGLLYGYTRNADFEQLEEGRRFFAWEWESLPANVVSVERWVEAVSRNGTRGFKYEFDKESESKLKSPESIFELFVALWANGNAQLAKDIEKERNKSQWEDFSKIKIERVKRDGNKSEGSD